MLLEDSGALTAGYCLIFKSVKFGPQGILRLRLAGIVLFLCLSVSGLEGFSGSSCGELSSVLVGLFWASMDSGAPAVAY